MEPKDNEGLIKYHALWGRTMKGYNKDMRELEGYDKDIGVVGVELL